MGFILRPRLNGVLMALEGGGCRKVRVSVPEAKMGEKQGVDIQVVIQTGYSFFRKLDIQNSCPSIP